MARTLSFRQIEAFRAVVLTGSISGGASFLGLTQPAVSRLIRDLEHRTGLALFERRGNAVKANAEALLLFREVEQQFHGLERIETAVRQIREAQHGSLHICAFTGVTVRFLPRVIARYLEKHPGAKVTLRNLPSNSVLEGIALRRYDLGVALAPTDFPGVDSELLPGLRAVCAVPADHPLAKAEAVSITDLHAQPLLSLGQSSPIWAGFRALVQAQGVEPQVLVEASVSEALCTLVALGRGIGIIDPFTASGWPRPGIALRPLVPQVPYPVYLVFSKGVLRSRMVEELAGLIREETAALCVET